MMNVGIIGHAAFAAWMQGTLSERFDTVLHEPLPSTLLALLDAWTEAHAVSMRVQDKAGHANS